VQHAHDAAHAILRRIAVSKVLTPPGVGREIVLSWLAAACMCCEPRTDGGEKAVVNPNFIDRGCSDAFALGIAAVALAFVVPVLDRFEKAPAETLERVDPSHAESLSMRLGNLLSGRRLATPPAGAGVCRDAASDEADEVMAGTNEAAAARTVAAAPPVEASWLASATLFGEAGNAPAHFMTECYFLAMRAIQVGTMPAVHRRDECLQILGQSYWQVSGGETGWPPLDTPAHAMLDAISIADDCYTSALLMESTAVATIRLLGLVLASVHSVLQDVDETERQRRAALVPEAMVRAVVNFATFVINAGAPDLFAASRSLDDSMLVCPGPH
jgi:hypothetical protein